MDKAIILLLITIILVCLSVVCVFFLENARKKDPEYKNSKLNKKRKTVYVISFLIIVGVPVTVGFAFKLIHKDYIRLENYLHDLETYQKDSIGKNEEMYTLKDSVIINTKESLNVVQDPRERQDIPRRLPDEERKTVPPDGRERETTNVHSQEILSEETSEKIVAL